MSEDEKEWIKNMLAESDADDIAALKHAQPGVSGSIKDWNETIAAPFTLAACKEGIELVSKSAAAWDNKLGSVPLADFKKAMQIGANFGAPEGDKFVGVTDPGDPSKKFKVAANTWPEWGKSSLQQMIEMDKEEQDAAIVKDMQANAPSPIVYFTDAEAPPMSVQHKAMLEAYMAKTLGVPSVTVTVAMLEEAQCDIQAMAQVGIVDPVVDQQLEQMAEQAAITAEQAPWRIIELERQVMVLRGQLAHACKERNADTVEIKRLKDVCDGYSKEVNAVRAELSEIKKQRTAALTQQITHYDRVNKVIDFFDKEVVSRGLISPSYIATSIKQAINDNAYFQTWQEHIQRYNTDFAYRSRWLSENGSLIATDSKLQEETKWLTVSHLNPTAVTVPSRARTVPRRPLIMTPPGKETSDANTDAIHEGAV